MKKIIIRALSVIGLVPARSYADASRRADEMRAQVAIWKKRTDKAVARGVELEQRAAELKRRLDQHAESSKGRHRAREIQNADLEKMQQRLAQAEEALVAATQHLMTIEVKLEILEGAANVLDARTRAAIHQARKTDAAV